MGCIYVCIYLNGVEVEAYEMTQGRSVKMIARVQREWIFSQLLYAELTALVTESPHLLQCLELKL